MAMDTNVSAFILTGVITFVTGGGLIGLITAAINRKNNKETNSLEKEKFYHSQHIETQEKHENKIRILEEQVLQLQQQINELIAWHQHDTINYVMWLENQLRKRDPDLDFPTRHPLPLKRNNE